MYSYVDSWLDFYLKEAFEVICSFVVHNFLYKFSKQNNKLIILY